MNPENGKKTYESIEIPKNLNETVMQTIASKNKEELKMRIRISLFCILCLLLGACSNEEMIPSTSEGGEECAFQFLLRVPGTIDVETKAGTEPKILKLGDTNIYNVWILQFKKDGTELLKAVCAGK